MRDTLTALAGAVILILVAALAAPPFIDWAGRRDLIDRAVGASLGLPARSEGQIEVRLLPSPRLRLDRLRLGGEHAGKPALDARFVKAEVQLAPLLKGEFRFTETRIGRAEVSLPVTESDAVAVPPDLPKSTAARDLVIEDLRVQQFLVTTQVPATGRTDQFLAEGLHVKAPSLAGPWQVEGLSGGVPFRVATGTVGPDGTMTIKTSGGGEGKPRFEADARVVLKPVDAGTTGPGGEQAMVPETEGTARLVVGAAPQGAEPRLPFSLGGKFKARGTVARFESVNAEIDPGGQGIRLAGTGRVDLRNWRAALTLDGRRLNLDALRSSSSGQALLSRALSGGGLSLPMLLDLDLKIESMALGLEEWSDVAFKGTFDRAGGLVLKRFAGTAPGEAKIEASGEAEIAPEPRFGGRLDFDAGNSEGFGRYLRKLGAEGPALSLLDGRAFRLAGDVKATGSDVELKNLRLALGEAKLTGDARYAKAQETAKQKAQGEAQGKAEGNARGRFAARLDARGVDIAELPPLGGFLPGLEQHDVDLKLSARDVRYGPAGADSGQGRISASIQSDGASLVVDSLDIADLAGANAKLSGRIAPDGAGRVAGRVSAPKAAPLLALLDRVWIAESRLIPRFLREGALDLDVSLEREAGRADSLRATAKGKTADSALDGSVLTRGGRIEALDASLSGPRAGRWFGRDDIAGLRQPAKLTLSGRRGTSGQGTPHLDLTANGSLAGLTFSTIQPLALGPESGPPEAGRLRFETTDLTPFLTLAGSAPVGTPLPADLTVALSRKGEDAHGELTGRIAQANASASLDRSAEGALTGKAALARLSLPALAGALVLPTEGGGEARFAAVPAHPRADLSLTVEALDLGRGLVAKNAALETSLDGDTLTLKNLSGALAGGRIAGSATLTRQGAGASVSGEGSLDNAVIAELAAASPIKGRLSTALRYSATGDTPAALLANLGGSGEIALAELRVPGAEPGAIERALTRALAEDDPLREGRVAALLAEEFAAGPLDVKGPVKVSATLVGGTLRSGPVAFELGRGRWAGTFALDLARQRLDARGALTANAAPKGWTGAKPSVQLGFSGPLSAPQRELDAGPLTNGLSALVLQRELEKIELSDADQAERQRRRARIDMDKARATALKAEADRIAAERAAAEKAAAEKAAAEKAEAERLAREKAAAEKAEADRVAREKAAAERAAAERAAKERVAAEEAARAARLRAQQAAAEEQARQERDRRDAEEAARRARIDGQRRSPDGGDPVGSNRPPEP